MKYRNPHLSRIVTVTGLRLGLTGNGLEPAEVAVQRCNDTVYFHFGSTKPVRDFNLSLEQFQELLAVLPRGVLYAEIARRERRDQQTAPGPQRPVADYP